MASVQISEFYLACGIVLLWAIPVQNCIVLEIGQRSQYNHVIDFTQFLFIFELILQWHIPVQNFVVIGPLTTKIQGGCPSRYINTSKTPVRLGVSKLLNWFQKTYSKLASASEHQRKSIENAQVSSSHWPEHWHSPSLTRYPLKSVGLSLSAWEVNGSLTK